MSAGMEALTKLAWLSLAALHLPPASVLAAPALAQRLYGVEPDGAVMVLIVHRGALFLALVVIASWAAFDPALRRAASVAVAVSVVGFLVVHWRGGMVPELRAIALADMVALVPLLWIGWRAWRP